MNKVILMGRLTREPEVRYTQGSNPTAVAKYSLAVPRKFNKDGQKVYTTDVVVEEQEFCESKAQQQDQKPEPSSDGFMNIPDGIDEELPFA